MIQGAKELFVAVVIFVMGACVAFADAVSAPFRRKEDIGVLLDRLDEDVLLDAIAQVESGNNPKAIGQCGERTEYQIMPGTWQRFSTVPFRDMPIVSRNHRRNVARLILQDLRREAVQRGCLVQSPQLLAGGWRHGPAFMLSACGTETSQRVACLYYDLLSRREKGLN
jgi:hypothetical protein